MKKILALILAVIMVFAFAACKKADAPAADAPAADAPAADEPAKDVQLDEDYETSDKESLDAEFKTEGLVFGVAHCVMGEQYWEADVVGMQKAADELGIELIVQGAQNDPSKQVEQIENFIAQEVDAIICSPVDVNAILTSVAKCNEAGIPFIFNSRVTESLEGAVVDSGVGYDAVKMSEAGAEWLVNYAKTNNVKLNLLEVQGAMADSHTIACMEGLRNVVEGNEDYVEIVAQVPTDWDPAVALSGTLAALKADDTINAIYYHSDALYPSVKAALMQLDMFKAKGEEGHVVLMACGGTTETLDDIKAGYVDALEVTPIVEVGYESVFQAVRVLSGEVQTGESLLYDAYVLDETNYDEKSGSVYGYAA